MKKNISVQNVFEELADETGEDFVLSSNKSAVETRKLSSYHMYNENDLNSNYDYSVTSPSRRIAKGHNEVEMIESPTVSPMKARLLPLGGKTGSRKTSSKRQR